MKEQGIIMLTDEQWAKAKVRSEVIAPLIEMEVIGQEVAREAAMRLGVSVRRLYELIGRYKQGTGLVTDMAAGGSTGGKGKMRVWPEVETIIGEVLSTMYLTRQKRSKALVVSEIRMRCQKAGYKAPSYNTIDLRIAMLDPMVVARKRHGRDAVRRLTPVVGETPETAGPLELVQIDHTKMDVIVVDEKAREPIGRPSLTLAIDVFTRSIVGMLLTLEAPSATSVGLCLANVVSDKSAWLERLGLDIGMWPMHGKPKKIHVDNAPEFKSEALKRGCEQHRVERDYRPKKQPHYGGIIERVIGTAMTMAHQVPGTTFSNTQEKGTYKSEERAILTLGELERWLVLAIGTYHKKVHDSLGETPEAVWERSVKSWEIATVGDKQGFLIDFLPVIMRSIGRTGFVIDHITYYGDALKHWIARRDRLDKFVIRRDPRDLSRVWVLDPESRLYFEVPYRALSRPPITLWEHKQAVANLRKRGREQVDEAALFEMVEQMREITEKAAAEQKRARRNKARSAHLSGRGQEVVLAVPADEVSGCKPVKSFSIEELSGVTADLVAQVPNDEAGLNRAIMRFEVEEW